MDLIGKFHPPSSKGNRYALTVICMLTGFTFCIPLKTKSAKDIVTAYLDNIYCVFGPSKKILTDNGSEFRNKMWEQVFKDARMSHLTSPIYSPQCNGRIKGFHKFLKATIGKQLHRGLEWDDLLAQATSAYNFFPTESSKESLFFLMFGRQPAVKHMLLDLESTKYLGNDEGKMKIELMRKLYHVIAYNIAKSRAARDGNKCDKEEEEPEPEPLEPGMNVLVRDHTRKSFEANYEDHVVVEILRKNKVMVKDNHGHEKKVHRKDVKAIDSDIKITQLYDELRAGKARDEKHCMPVKQIPDLKWECPDNQKTPEITPSPTPQDNPEPKPQRQESTLRCSRRLVAKQESTEEPEMVKPAEVTEVEVSEVEVSKVQVSDFSKSRNQTTNLIKVAATTAVAAICTAAYQLIDTNLL